MVVNATIPRMIASIAGLSRIPCTSPATRKTKASTVQEENHTEFCIPFQPLPSAAWVIDAPVITQMRRIIPAMQSASQMSQGIHPRSISSPAVTSAPPAHSRKASAGKPHMAACFTNISFMAGTLHFAGPAFLTIVFAT
eukprot:4719723-Amphidinium_carterae.1